MNKLKTWFNSLTMTGKVASVATALILSFGVIGAAAQTNTNTPVVPATETTQTAPVKPAAPKIEVKTATTTDSIPFTSSTVNDNTLASGITQVRTVGVNGVLTHTYNVTYSDGTETSRSRPVDVITTPAVNEVKVLGTYVAPAPAQVNCQNGTYVNSAGNTVCSPYSSSSAPAGASAQCSDGTYSFSQSRSGTCSHHGGVTTWL